MHADSQMQHSKNLLPHTQQACAIVRGDTMLIYFAAFRLIDPGDVKAN